MFETTILTLALMLATTPDQRRVSAEHIPRIVSHFASEGIVLKPKNRPDGQREWIARYPRDRCFKIVTGFRAFQTREQMEHRMLKYSAGSVSHPKFNVAMFLPALSTSA